jgi:1,4-dihydroxy-2-naphthoate octaprenyltransferase
MVAAEFCIIVLCNMLLFSLFDHDRDLRDHHHSFVTAMGDKKARFVLTFLFALNGLLILSQFIWLADRRGILLIVLFMNLMLLAIFLFHERFKVNDNYRLLGDLVFLAPLLLLL